LVGRRSIPYHHPPPPIWDLALPFAFTYLTPPSCVTTCPAGWFVTGPAYIAFWLDIWLNTTPGWFMPVVATAYPTYRFPHPHHVGCLDRCAAPPHPTHMPSYTHPRTHAHTLHTPPHFTAVARLRRRCGTFPHAHTLHHTRCGWTVPRCPHTHPRTRCVVDLYLPAPPATHHGTVDTPYPTLPCLPPTCYRFAHDTPRTTARTCRLVRPRTAPTPPLVLHPYPHPFCTPRIHTPPPPLPVVGHHAGPR